MSAGSQRYAGGRALAAVCVVLFACRKPPPAERVYTGKGPTLPGTLLPVAAGMAASAGVGIGTESEATPVLAAASDAGCVRPAAATGPFSKAQLIGAVADCAVWQYCEFESGARTLEAATRVARDDASAGNLERAQQAFLSAMGSWQRAELFRFGPAARSAEPGGGDLRDLIYAWPARAECKVDEQTVSLRYAAPEFHSLDFGVSPVTGRTLTALEYLLFNTALQNRCSAYAAINAGGGWAALAADELRARRRAYAAEVAADVHARAEALRQAWSENGGGFRQRFVQSGPDNPTFKSEQQVLNTVSNALFYLDLELKDLKLATPLGLTPECSATVCPDAVESRYTEASLAYLRENLVGFRRLFQGCGADYAGVGFDDWLRDAGGAELAERMLASLAALDAALAQVPGSLAQVLVTRRELPLAVHGAVKAVSDELKTEFVTLLNLELPSASEGDND